MIEPILFGVLVGSFVAAIFVGAHLLDKWQARRAWHRAGLHAADIIRRQSANIKSFEDR